MSANAVPCHCFAQIPILESHHGDVVHTKNRSIVPCVSTELF